MGIMSPSWQRQRRLNSQLSAPPARRLTAALVPFPPPTYGDNGGERAGRRRAHARDVRGAAGSCSPVPGRAPWPPPPPLPQNSAQGAATAREAPALACACAGCAKALGSCSFPPLPEAQALP